MTPAAVQALRAEIGSDVRAFDARLADLAALSLDEEAALATLAHAAVSLHHAYGAIEAALLRLSRFFEGEPPAGPDWHLRLLERSALPIPEVRPALLSAEAASLLRRLLSFRHFFRHAYAVAWDASRLAELASDARKARVAVARDLQEVDEMLREIARKLL